MALKHIVSGSTKAAGNTMDAGAAGVGVGAGDIKQRTRQCPKGHRKRKEATGVLARWPDVAKELGRKHQLSSLCGVSPILSPTPLICRSSYGKNGCLLLT